MSRTDFDRSRFFNSRTFDEANYYQGMSFELGGRRGIHRSDDRIQEEAWCELKKNIHSGIGNIEIFVQDGVIKLVGSVDRLTDKWKAESSVDEIPGVVNILNELKVKKLFG